MFRLLLCVVPCCVVAGLAASAAGAAPPERYELKPGLAATYDFEVEVHERDRVMVWKGSPTYVVESVEGDTAVVRYDARFEGSSSPRNGAGAAAAGPQPSGRGTSTSSTQSSFRVTARGEVSGGPRSSELPLPLPPVAALPFVVLPETPADRWELKGESELGLVATLFQPNQVGPGPASSISVFGSARGGGFAFEERLHLTETVACAAKPDRGEFERVCTISSAEQVNGKPRIEFNSTGTVAFAEDGFLPARVEWSGELVLRTGAGEVTSPVRVAVRRVSDAELAERAAAAEQARLDAAAKLREDLDQLVADLKSGDDLKARAAASRLDSDLAGEGDAAVAAALQWALRSSRGRGGSAFGRALVRWATPEQAEALIDLLDEQDVSTRRLAIERLSALRVETAIPALAGRLRDNFDRSRAAEALKKFGSVAEPAVLELLRDSDWSVKRQAIDVLETIGTGKSIGPLKEAAKDMNPIVKRSAEAAIKAIEKRINAPIT